MDNIKTQASIAFTMLSLTSLLTAAIPQQVNAFGLSDLDPSSTVRELGREVDITDQNSGIRELGREVDITDQNSELRELGREVDPSTKVDEWVDDRVNNAGEAASQQTEEVINNVGEAASQKAEEIGQTSLNFAVQIAMVIGGLVSFLFVLSILRGLMKRIVT